MEIVNDSQHTYQESNENNIVQNFDNSFKENPYQVADNEKDYNQSYNRADQKLFHLNGRNGDEKDIQENLLNYKLELNYNEYLSNIYHYQQDQQIQQYQQNDQMVEFNTPNKYKDPVDLDRFNVDSVVSTNCGIDSLISESLKDQYYYNYYPNPVQNQYSNLREGQFQKFCEDGYERVYNYGMPTIANLSQGKCVKDDKCSNSTIENDSISDVEDPDGVKPPANRSDPIYTSISGLKWKSKSKKWVVRWDNPITNRRVYKYFSGTRYGFLGAHKRAKFYLEFLNASVGKIQATTPGNPFCRRTEGPPKGKRNKSLIRKLYYSNEQNFIPQYYPQAQAMNPNNTMGNSAQNPWYFPNTGQVYNNF